ncbi:MAG: histidine phosphatase family protein [Lachnospiraceae bacterium]|nr:histidine phosphatase family protein [Lachnospiraceae bacterium]
MKIILIRHGDPDYANDSLTEKGRREATLLAGRVAKWKVTGFYSSPLGRAVETASFCMKKSDRKIIMCDWLKEFYFPVTDPVSGRFGVPWDFVPSFRTNEPLFYDRTGWPGAKVMQSAPEIKDKYSEVCTELDKLLAKYGYLRDGGFYRVPGKKEVFIKETAAPGSTAASFHSDEDEDVIVMFCHLGIISVLLSHLLGIPFPLVPHSFYLAPTSVTILGSEERWSNEAAFRIQVAGDTTHLYTGGEPISCAGAYFSAFQEYI